MSNDIIEDLIINNIKLKIIKKLSNRIKNINNKELYEHIIYVDNIMNFDDKFKEYKNYIINRVCNELNNKNIKIIHIEDYLKINLFYE